MNQFKVDDFDKKTQRILIWKNTSMKLSVVLGYGQMVKISTSGLEFFWLYPKSIYNQKYGGVMDKIKYLKLLAKSYGSISNCYTWYLEAILNLPKGTVETFMTDLHGEYESFDYIWNGSGNISI